MRIEFTIPYMVAPKNADRSRVVQTGGKAWSHHYQPKSVMDNARALALLCAEHRPKTPMLGPIYLDLTYLYPWRKSEPEKDRPLYRPKDTSPDLCNLDKQLVDVLERSGFFTNDSHVVEKHSRKRWADQGGVWVVIEELTEKAE